MHYVVLWTAKATSDLGEHVAFLCRASASAASGLTMAILEVGKSLDDYPERFPAFPMPRSFPHAVRKCVIKKRYIMLYGICDNTVLIYRILDARKRFDGLLE